MKVFVVNSAGGSFCWNYATDALSGNYADGNVCCIYAGFDMVLSVIGMLVDLLLQMLQMQVTVSVPVMQLEVSSAHMQVTVSVANTRLTIFIVIIQMRVSVANMQKVFSAVHYAHDSFFYSYVGDSSKYQFHIPFSNW